MVGIVYQVYIVRAQSGIRPYLPWERSKSEFLFVIFHTRIGRITRFLIKHFGGK